MLENIVEFDRLRGFRIHPDNLPLQKPGAYGIYCLSTGKWYIGISQNIFKRAKGHQKNLGKGRLRSAIKCYGLDQFVFFPLIYSIDGTDWSPALEAELIVAFDSFKNGYNLVAIENTVGPYGSAFSQVVKMALSDPKVRERISIGTRQGLLAIGGRKNTSNFDQNRTPEKRAAISESTRRAWRDPESRAQRMKNKRIASAKLEVRQKISIATKGALKNPEIKAKHSATVTGYVWITNGKKDQWVDSKSPIAEGWRLGRALLRGRRWITNSVETKMILSSDPIPDGWILGRKMRRDLTPREEGR